MTRRTGDGSLRKVPPELCAKCKRVPDEDGYCRHCARLRYQVFATLLFIVTPFLSLNACINTPHGQENSFLYERMFTQLFFAGPVIAVLIWIFAPFRKRKYD